MKTILLPLTRYYQRYVYHYLLNGITEVDPNSPQWMLCSELDEPLDSQDRWMHEDRG